MEVEETGENREGTRRDHEYNINITGTTKRQCRVNEKKIEKIKLGFIGENGLITLYKYRNIIGANHKLLFYNPISSKTVI